MEEVYRNPEAEWGDGDRLLACSSATGPEGQPTMLELNRTAEGVHLIIEWDLTDIEAGFYWLASALSPEKIGLAWGELTGDWSTRDELIAGRL